MKKNTIHLEEAGYTMPYSLIFNLIPTAYENN